jgi:isopenicillin-N epimerase
LPIRDLAALCRERGVPVAVDGAHAPGQIALDVPALGVDWYVGNLHKWAFAAKGTGVIWCRPERQAGLHPTAISHALGQGFAAEFDYIGTATIRPGSPRRRRSTTSTGWGSRRCRPATPRWRARPVCC